MTDQPMSDRQRDDDAREGLGLADAAWPEIRRYLHPLPRQADPRRWTDLEVASDAQRIEHEPPDGSPGAPERAEPPAALDDYPRFERIDQPPHEARVGRTRNWREILTWIVVGAFTVTVVTAILVVVFDGSARVAVMSALITALTGALIRLAGGRRP